MTTTRTRTPSEIKWLANELAATKGALGLGWTVEVPAVKA